MESELTLKELSLFLGCNLMVFPKDQPEYLTILTPTNLYIKESKKILLKKYEDMTKEDAMCLIDQKTHLLPKVFSITNYKISFSYQCKNTTYREIGQIELFHLTTLQFKYLLLNNFDVFGWIDKDLALREIDILQKLNNQTNDKTGSN